ncbi:NADAR family protein [Cellulophaga sp. L1A9]|uniref:NADAR family protein n=1 Tax=Cellulophaga sp. L1A9 TaxID=2686362 RepID=UPI00131C8246|nr:NADAR family protein [Cellulophaga sp. L1A9]
MDFKKLSDKEIKQLPKVERYAYYDKLSLVELDNWKQLSWSDKKKDIFSGYEFYIGRRGIEGINLEEIIDIAIKNSPNKHSDYISPIIKLYNERILVNEDYTFFWETKSPFSQWYKSAFEATTLLVEGISYGNEIYKVKRQEILGDFPFEVQEYSSAEQFMMYHKAMIFLDRETARKIMLTNNVKIIKELGRQVSDFNLETWKYFRSKIVYEGNKAKFSQNKELKQALLDTASTTLVESAPNDRIWGIGLSKDNIQSKKRETWKGKNLLGEILTIIREEFLTEQ